MATSLEILQAYPLGTLEVKVNVFVPHIVARCVLVGIDLSDPNDVPCIVEHRNDKGYLLGHGRYLATSLTPCLRPFSALCELLPDGTVPAIELAKALTYYPAPSEDSEAAQPDWKMAHCFLDGDKVEVVWDEDEPGEGGEEYTQQFTIDAYWSGHWHGEDGNEPAGPAMTDWLRRHHFALPINGRPLLEGVDYIPKTSSAAPIDKNTAP